MAARHLPSRAELRQILRYDRETGKLYWLARSASMFEPNARQSAEAQASAWNGRNAGRQAFTAADGKGYLQGQVLGYHTMAHRVIWAWSHGQWPAVIDHIDGDGTNNRLSNLRSVTWAENARNSALPSNNTSGAVGVRMVRSTGRWSAHITVGQKQCHLGTFNCPTAARIARRQAEAKHGFHGNHGRPLGPTRIRSHKIGLEQGVSA